MMRFTLPLVILVALAALFAYSLREGRDVREVPFPGVGKPAPAFTLPQLHDPAKKFSPADMKGRVWLFNMWASWCAACRDEHPLLLALSQQNIVTIVGLDYKDKQADAEAWLAAGGNPYALTVADVEGRIGIDYGITAVPETLVIDKHGVVQKKIYGMITAENLKNEILPLVAKLEKEQ